MFGLDKTKLEDLYLQSRESMNGTSIFYTFKYNGFKIYIEYQMNGSRYSVTIFKDKVQYFQNSYNNQPDLTFLNDETTRTN